MYHILFDDQRNLNGMDFIIRSADAMCDFISKFNTTGHFVYFDSDIGHPSIQGFNVLEYLIALGQRPNSVAIVTSNPVDAEKMRVLLCKTNYESTDNIVYRFKGEANG